MLPWLGFAFINTEYINALSRADCILTLDLILLRGQCLKGLAGRSLHRCSRMVLKEVFLSRLFQIDIFCSVHFRAHPEKYTGFPGEKELWNYDNYPIPVLKEGYRPVGIVCRVPEFLYWSYIYCVKLFPTTKPAAPNYLLLKKGNWCGNIFDNGHLLGRQTLQLLLVCRLLCTLSNLLQVLKHYFFVTTCTVVTTVILDEN